MLLRFVGLLNPTLTLSCLINFQRRESDKGDFSQYFDVGMPSDIYRGTSFKLGVKIDTTKLHCLMPV